MTNTGKKDCEKEQWDPEGGRPPRCRHEQGGDDHHDGCDKINFLKIRRKFYYTPLKVLPPPAVQL